MIAVIHRTKIACEADFEKNRAIPGLPAFNFRIVGYKRIQWFCPLADPIVDGDRRW
jgi:hypothetical protein